MWADIHEWNYGFIYLSYKLHFCYLANRVVRGTMMKSGGMMKKNNLHLAIIRIIPYTKSILRVVGWFDGGEHSLVAAKKRHGMKVEEKEGGGMKKFRWCRSEGWKNETSSQSCVVRRRKKTVFTWYRHTHLAEYISGFLLLWIGDGFFGGWEKWERKRFEVEWATAFVCDVVRNGYYGN